MINPASPKKVKKALANKAHLGGRSTNAQLEINLFGVLRSKQKEVKRALDEYDVAVRNLSKLERDYIYEHRPPVSWKGGFTMVPNEILCATDLSEAEKTCWAIVYMFAWDRRSSWPSVERIATLLGKCKRTAQRYLKHLVRRGYIIVELRKDPRTGNLSNRYRFNIERFEKNY